MDRGGKRKKEVVNGKEPKEPLESSEEMRQREQGETGQKQGGTSESEEVNTKKGRE